jgi:hypothetical protein
MFSNSYSGPSGLHPELDPALIGDSAPVDMMSNHVGKHASAGIEEPQYSLPPISQDFARPSLSETRRPATSAGLVHNLNTTTDSHANESPEYSTHGEFDPSPDINQEQTYTHIGGGMMMSHQQQQQHQQHAQHQHQQQHLPQPPQMHFHQNRPDLRTQNSGYAVALPPISHDFARPSTSETRRPATSAGILQRSMAPGTFGAMSAFSSLDAQRRASIGLGTINEHQSVTPQPQQQALPQGLSTQQSSGYGMTPAQATYAHALEAHARRQSDMASGYHGMFAHSIDGIDPNLTGMLNIMDITRRFSVPTLTTLPFQRPTTSLSAVADPAATGQSALNSARSLNSVRFNNPVKMETAAAVVDGGYDTRPGSSGGPIFPTDYRMGLHGGFDPSTGTPNGFFPGAGDMTPQQQHQLYTLHSAASGVFPSGSYSSAGSIAGAAGATGGGMLDHRNGSYSSVSIDSTRHDSMTESSRNPSLPDIYLHHHLNNRRMSMDAIARNPSVADIYLNQHLQRRPSTGGNGGIHSTTLADAAAHQMGLLNHNEDPSSGPVHKKRPRRKFDQIERLYLCGYEGCNKSYGTLNHLNAHVSMQKHGEKRRPEGESRSCCDRPRANDLAEFKEIRAAWRKRKKEEAKEVAEHHAVVHGAVHHPLDIERMEKDAYEAQGKWLAH